MEIKGVGVDLVQISRLRQVVERWRNRFLARVFTEAELQYCFQRRDPIPHLAARFAAKEAALKALGTGLRMGIRWRDIEVQRAKGRPPALVLSGRFKTIGEAKGASRGLLSLTHDGDYAVAQAMLIGDPAPAGRLAGAGSEDTDAEGR
ncbi:MAG: holo-ACP synthase [Candidatus Methylomirabilia bacterium]